MRSFSRLSDLSRTDHEYLWLSAAGWHTSGLHRRNRGPQRVGIVGRPLTTRDDLALRAALDALSTSVLSIDEREETTAEALADLGSLVDAVIAFQDIDDPAGVGAPIIVGDARDTRPVAALAMCVRHVLSGRLLAGTAMSLVGAEAGAQAALTDLASVFPLTLHIDQSHPRPDLLERVAAPSSVTLQPLEAASFDTSEVPAPLLAATWAALIEVLST